MQDMTPIAADGPPEAHPATKMTCFVVMPFGDKKHPITGRDINFDDVYKRLIKPTVESEGLDCVRSDEISKAGLIHRDMIDRIIRSDVVITDITTGNANVMYELGIRHAARKWGTIILRQAGRDAIPFNISGLRAVDYDLEPEEALEHSQQLLATNIRNCLRERSIDSLVHTLLPGLNMTQRAEPWAERKTFVWSVPGIERTKLCIVRGDIQNVDMVDLWVNPENTKMQMGRYHDNSISSYIRYFGSKRDHRGAVVKDKIDRALRSAMRDAHAVEPATVLVTEAGSLRRQNNVLAILHVAAQHGEPGQGYQTIRSYPNCVSNVLDRADQLNRSWWWTMRMRRKAQSILFPLFGTQGELEDPQLVVVNLVQAAKMYLETWRDFSLKRIYFQAYTNRDDELCVTAFNRLGLKYEGNET